MSSDSDFTRLAARIREQGVDVYGFGEQKTPESFRQACRRFVYTENLLPQVQKPDHAEHAGIDRARVVQPPSAAAPLIKTAIAQLEDEDGWVSLSGVGHRLAVLAPDFDSRSYGQSKLVDLVRKAGFETRNEGRGVYIRAKPATQNTSAPKPRARR